MASSASARFLSRLGHQAVRGICYSSNVRPPLYFNKHLRMCIPQKSADKAFYSAHSSQTMTQESARALVLKLNDESRDVLLGELKRYKENGLKNESVVPLTRNEWFAVSFSYGLPFVAFGIMDNTIMIFAGDAIQFHLGAFFVISTMAAAGLGNMVSDVAGVLSNAWVEKHVGRVINIPQLTPAQTLSMGYKSAKTMGRVVGVVFGCAVGMLSLLFIHDEDELPTETQADSAVADAQTQTSQSLS